jgi:hypothetical protein
LAFRQKFNCEFCDAARYDVSKIRGRGFAGNIQIFADDFINHYGDAELLCPILQLSKTPFGQIGKRHRRSYQ